jgi:hypothetical protein
MANDTLEQIGKRMIHEQNPITVKIDLNTTAVRVDLYQALNNVIADAQWMQRMHNRDILRVTPIATPADVEKAILVLRALGVG